MHLIFFFVVLHASIHINSLHSLKNVYTQLLVVACHVTCCPGKINIVFDQTVLSLYPHI